MSNPMLVQLDSRHHALARRMSAAMVAVLDGEILAPWEVFLVLSLATFDLHAKIAQYVEREEVRHD